MKKALFKNYNFNFSKNEAKLISNFCKQAIKQMSGDNNFLKDINVFNSILDKIQSNPSDVKFTKDEKTRFSMQLRENAKHINKTMEKAGFIKKWLLKSLYNQYNNILTTHFND